MKCPNCKEKAPRGHEMCIHCGYPIKPIPVPPGGKLRFGAYDWFVLDKQADRALIITEKVIEKRTYHHEEAVVTWETCDMRKYLNGEFLQSFSADEQARILETKVITPGNPWYGTSGGNPTIDKVFLLSIEEVLKYFGDSGQIKTRYMYPNCDWCKDEFLPWIDDEYNLNRCAVDDAGIVWHWRLRSLGSNPHKVATVMGFCGDGFDQGGIDISGCSDLKDGHFVFDGPGALTIQSQRYEAGLTDYNPQDYHNLNGVRPALWLKL